MARGIVHNKKRTVGKTFLTHSREPLGYAPKFYSTRLGRREKFERIHRKVAEKYWDQVAASKGLSAEYCEECEKRIPLAVLGDFQEDVYERPHQENARIAKMCSEECYDDFHNNNYEFSYWHCDDCDRYICQRNPGNG